MPFVRPLAAILLILSAACSGPPSTSGAPVAAGGSAAGAPGGDGGGSGTGSGGSAGEAGTWSPPACNGAWCWANPPPDLKFGAISGTADDDVWRLSGDTVSHWDGKAWTARELSPGTYIALFAAAPNDVWVLGEKSVLHFDGQSWQPVPLPEADVRYTDLQGSGPGDLWLVGDARLWKWTGSTWVPFPSPSRNRLAKVRAVAPDDVWLGTNAGAFYHWDGTAWSARTRVDVNDPSFNLLSLWASGPDDAWAIVSVFRVGTELLHWDGKLWNLVRKWLPVGMASVFGRGRDDVWLASGSVEHWDGQRWRLEPLSGDTGWAAPRGHVYLAGYTGAFGRTDGTTTQRFSERAELQSLSAVWGGGREGVAAGGEFARVGAQGWTPVPAPLFGVGVRAMWGSAANDIWAIGHSAPDHQDASTNWALHWDGSAWTPADFPLVVGQAMAGRARDDVWAFGHGEGHTAAHFDGKSWSAAPGPPTSSQDVDGAWMASNGEVWVVGEYFLLRRSAKGTWAAIPGAPMRGDRVWGTGPTDVWIAGESFFHYDGQTWTRHDGPDGSSILLGEATGLMGSGPADIWACSQPGIFAHWNGKDWRQVGGDLDTELRGLWIGPDGKGWALAGHGGILARGRR
jgi:hypothetical protein